LGQQGEKVGGIAMVEGLRQLGQDDLAPGGDLGGNDARGVTPVELTRAGFLAGGLRVGSGGGRRGRRGAGFAGLVTVAFALIVAFLAAQFTVRIALGLLGLVEALGDVGLGIVFL
jgi:hypothetical protein